jgi:hypothetical protein
MKRGSVLPIFLALILIVSISSVSAQTYSGFSKLTDNIKLFFSSGDGKVKLALEIREKELNSAIENAKSGNNKEVIKNLEDAKNKLKIVQERVSPNTAETVRSNVDEAKDMIKENKNIDSQTTQYFESYLTEEEKTTLSVDLSEKVFNYCKELASQSYDSMTNDEKCKSYSWMGNLVKEKIEKDRVDDTEKIKKEMSTCMSNPKDCNCDEISLASEKANCEKYKASTIRCEFQSDSSACKEIGSLKIDVNDQKKADTEKAILEKYLPAECSEAGVRNGEECKKLILTLYQPKSECMENGKYVGEEKCNKKIVDEGNAMPNCVVNGKIVDPKQCLNTVKEENKPSGEDITLMSGECKERGVYDPIACDEIVNLPRPCKDAGYYTKTECEVFTLKQNLPKECIEAGALTPGACEKLKLPSDCQGEAFSREDCEKIKIEQKFPDECKSAGELDPAKCAVIMVGKESLVVTAGSEMEYLVRQGLKFEEIPKICLNGKNFIRSMNCDAELAKLGITLPTPTDTGGIPKECMVDEKTAVSPQECQNRIEKNIIIDTIPQECQDAKVTDPKKCSNLIVEKRTEEGIGINMPSECFGISVEECKKIMQEKGIKIEKVEAVQQVEKVDKIEKVEKMCKEGEECSDQETEKVNVPKECIELGVSAYSDCKMVMGKINGERIKEGEKIIIDEQGNTDYITNDQINKIAEDSEKASQDVEPNTEKTEEMKEEIKDVENNIQELGEVNNEGVKETGEENNGLVDTKEENNVAGKEGNVIESSGGSENVVVSSDGGESSSESNSQTSEGGENTDSGGSGEAAPVTGGVIGSGNKESFLGKFLKEVFGI